MERLFVDTSAWYAFVNGRDPDHGRVRDALAGFGGRLVTSNFVFDETVTLCRTRLGHAIAVRVGTVLLDPQVVALIRLTADEEEKAWELFLARPDKAYSFTDCTSFVLMRGRGFDRAAALDADFQREGFETVL